MRIDVFNPSFVWETRHSIIPVTTLAIPLAIEAIHLAVKIYRNPSCVRDRFSQLKRSVVQAFTKSPQEGGQEYKKRLIKALSALMVVGAGSAAYFLAPSSFSLAAVLIAIQLAGKVWQGLDLAPSLLRRTINTLKDSFCQRTGESIESFHQRRFKAIKHVIGCTLIFAASVGALCGLGYIGYLLSQANDIWRLWAVLPCQTPLVVFAEYAVIGIAHAALAIHSWRKGNHGTALFHLISAITAVAFPISYIMEGKQVRLHHSFIGLALQLAPWRPLKCLGSVMTFDSFLDSYLGIKGLQRGAVIEQWGMSFFHQYDYQNALLENFPFAVTALASVTLLGRNTDYFSEKQSTDLQVFA